MLRFLIIGKAKNVWAELAKSAALEKLGIPAWHYAVCLTDFYMN